MRTRRVLALATAALVAFGGCGSIKERKENADRIIDSVDRATAAGSARMTLSSQVRLRLDRGAEQLASGGGPAPRTVLAVADLRQRRVAYLVLGQAAVSEATRVDAGTTIYVRRPTPSAASTPARPWVRVDLIGIDPEKIDNSGVELVDAVRRLPEAAGFDNPLFGLSLLRGALSGSVEEVGHEAVGGVPTTHYKLNIDREKAVRDDDEDLQDAYEVIFKSIYATATVLPGEVWLDEQGLPRRYVFTLKSKLRRRALADIRLTVELVEVGQPVDIALPDRSQTVKVDGLGGLAQAVTGGGG